MFTFTLANGGIDPDIRLVRTVESFELLRDDKLFDGPCYKLNTIKKISNKIQYQKNYYHQQSTN